MDGPTMKESLQRERECNASSYDKLRRALTPEELKLPVCRFWHRWQRVRPRVEDVAMFGRHEYYQCLYCFDRKVDLYRAGSCSAPSVLRKEWLKGGDWGPDTAETYYLALGIPSTTGPVSAVPNRPSQAVHVKR